MTKENAVCYFLRLLRAPAPKVMRAVFTRGGCYALVELLAYMFYYAEAWQTCRRDGKLTGSHVVARIRDEFYDITGHRKFRVSNTIGQIFIGKDRYRCMSESECRKARKWSPVCWDQVVIK